MYLLGSHQADDGGRGVLLGGRGGGVGPRHREEGRAAADDSPEHNLVISLWGITHYALRLKIVFHFRNKHFHVLSQCVINL